MSNQELLQQSNSTFSDFLELDDSLSKELFVDSLILESAKKMIDAGFCVLPAYVKPEDKRPACLWRDYQDRICDYEKFVELYEGHKANGMGIVCGSVSGNLEMLDLDCKNDIVGNLYDNFIQLIEQELPSILNKIVTEATINHGFHLWYRSPEELGGNTVLAVREPTDSELEREPKIKYKVLIETRSQGGFGICSPSHGYNIIAGSFETTGTLTKEEYTELHRICRSLNQVAPVPEVKPAESKGNRPGDLYNSGTTADEIEELLIKHGWVRVSSNLNSISFRRPGKESGISATLFKNRSIPILNVFSTSTVFKVKGSQSNSGSGFAPFEVYTNLEYDGDFKASAQSLRANGYNDEENPSGRSNTELEQNNIYWIVIDRERVDIIHRILISCFNSWGLYKYYVNPKESILLKIDNKLIEEIFPERIQDIFFNEHLPSLPIDPIIKDELREFMSRRNTSFFKIEKLRLLPPADINLLRDTNDTAYLFYKNAFVTITKDSVKLSSYEDLPGHIWKSQIINREIYLLNNEGLKNVMKCEFARFIYNITTVKDKAQPTNRALRKFDEERYNSLLSTIGYLMHDYKTSANNRAIVLCEETSPNAGKGSGRKGKGLIMQGISKLKNIAKIDGKNFKFSGQFPLQTVDLDTKLIFFDDVKKDFSFEDLFSMLTEGVEFEKKYVPRVRLKMEDSPKIVISTIYAIAGTSDSARARKFELELTNYYDADNTPDMEFGHLFFIGWDSEEWNSFDNFMIRALQFYLDKGSITQYQSKTLLDNKLIQETSEEFTEFMDSGSILIGKQYNKRQVYEEFLSVYSDYDNNKTKLSQKRFTMWIQRYAQHKGLELEETREPEGKSYLLYFCLMEKRDKK